MEARVLLCGYGSIGKRYGAILKSLNVPFDIYDPFLLGGDKKIESFKKDCSAVIIATPTETHVTSMLQFVGWGIPILCEKPISKIPEVLTEIDEKKIQSMEVYMVSNYKYVMDVCKLKEPYKILYDYYNTGKDGIFWDCCQILLLDESARIENKSPRWNVNVNGQWIKYRELEDAYVQMIRDFVSARCNKFWKLSHAKEMNRRVIRRIEEHEKENMYRNSNQKQFNEISKESLSSSV